MAKAKKKEKSDVKVVKTKEGVQINVANKEMAKCIESCLKRCCVDENCCR